MFTHYIEERFLIVGNSVTEENEKPNKKIKTEFKEKEIKKKKGNLQNENIKENIKPEIKEIKKITPPHWTDIENDEIENIKDIDDDDDEWELGGMMKRDETEPDNDDLFQE
jgi:hypothetical protein